MRTRAGPQSKALMLALEAFGHWVSLLSQAQQPLPSQSEPPVCFITCFTRLYPLPEGPLPQLLCQGSLVQPRRLTLEMLPCQCSLTGPLWGESESLSPALPGASGAFHHPSIYSLFESGAPGHVAGREGRASGWESRFCNLRQEGLGFSRTTPLAHVPLIHHL